MYVVGRHNVFKAGRHGGAEIAYFEYTVVGNDPRVVEIFRSRKRLAVDRFSDPVFSLLPQGEFVQF
jgi:hypothetical protein